MHLLDGLSDKEESVRFAIESALMKILEKQQNSALLVLCDYKIKHVKMNEITTSTILRYVLFFYYQLSFT